MNQLKSLAIIIVFLLLIPVMSEAGTVKGRMLMRDGTTSFANGMVLFFDARKGLPPDPHVEKRSPEYAEILDSEGKFDLALPPGEYYFGAIKRQDAEFGPPQPGDMFFINRDWTITVTLEENVELGDITLGEIFN